MSDAIAFSQRIKEVCTPQPGSIPETLYFKLSVKLKFEGFTLLDMYSVLFPHQLRGKWEEKINEGSLTVNGDKVSPDCILKAGWITQNRVDNRTEPTVSTDIRLVHEDEDFIVVNKPSPLPVHPAGRYNRNSLTEILKKAYPKKEFRIIHRIDANTTGLVVLAKNKQTANVIAKQFESQTVNKKYLALVEGLVAENTFYVKDSISKHKTSSGGRELSENGVEANTSVKVLQKYDKHTLLSVSPKSGRTNQIRLHLASIGNPIVGDLGYKDSSYFKSNPLTYPTDSLFLHAQSLSFSLNDQLYSFELEIPNKFKKFES